MPPPLPNLDFKVLCGDSLLGARPQRSRSRSKATLGYDAERVRQLRSRLKARLRCKASPYGSH